MSACISRLPSPAAVAPNAANAFRLGGTSSYVPRCGQARGDNRCAAGDSAGRKSLSPTLLAAGSR